MIVCVCKFNNLIGYVLYTFSRAIDVAQSADSLGCWSGAAFGLGLDPPLDFGFFRGFPQPWDWSRMVYGESLASTPLIWLPGWVFPRFPPPKRQMPGNILANPRTSSHLTTSRQNVKKCKKIVQNCKNCRKLLNCKTIKICKNCNCNIVKCWHVPHLKASLLM